MCLPGGGYQGEGSDWSASNGAEQSQPAQSVIIPLSNSPSATH